MSTNGTMNHHYSCNELVSSIESALKSAGVAIDNVTVDDLAPVDEFHTGGRVATAHLLEQINLEKGDKVLDIGCGIGGTGRYLADRYPVDVSGIDLTEEYVAAASVLNGWVSLSDRIDVTVGNATALPYNDGEFDIAIMLHVGMNISDKARLFSEVHRVLDAGGRFVLYDVMRKNDSDFAYPVPWASEASMNYLESSESYVAMLETAGFTIQKLEERGDFAKTLFRKMRASAKSPAALPPVGLHLLMGQDIREKTLNLSNAVFDDILEPIEIVALK